MDKPVPQSVLDKRRRRAARLKLCWVCHTEKPLTEYYTGSGRCKVCTKESARTWRTAPGNKHKPRPEYWRRQLRTPSARFSLGVKTAKKRGLVWEITRDQYDKIVAGGCAYCSGPLPEAGIGLDRIDSSRGYSTDNVAPCCTACNVAKSDRFSFSEMKFVIGPAIRRVFEMRRGAEIRMAGGTR
jgi:hypothetical protein